MDEPVYPTWTGSGESWTARTATAAAGRPTSSVGRATAAGTVTVEFMGGDGPYMTEDGQFGRTVGVPLGSVEAIARPWPKRSMLIQRETG